MGVDGYGGILQRELPSILHPRGKRVCGNGRTLEEGFLRLGHLLLPRAPLLLSPLPFPGEDP